MMTTITGSLHEADGTLANGIACISWVAFTTHEVLIVGGQKLVPITDGQLSVELYPTLSAFPRGMYYTVRMELESGAVYEEYWTVPDLPQVSIEQVRSMFPLEPGMMVNPNQIAGSGAEPGMILAWNGSYWEGSYVQVENVNPNWIRMEVGSAGDDFWIDGSPVSLGKAATFNIPSASLTARGLVTTGAQSFAGDKTFSGSVQVDGSITGPTITDIYSQINGKVPATRQIIAGTGMGGGGSLAADVTLTADVVTVNGQVGDVVISPGNIGGVPATRQVIAGAGLSGGGSLATDVTLTANVLSVNGQTGAVVLTPAALGVVQGHVIQDEGTARTHRAALNFVGDGVTVTDDAANNRSQVTITGGASGSQTPWLSHINANNFSLYNVLAIGIGGGENPFAAINVLTAGGGKVAVMQQDSSPTGTPGVVVRNNTNYAAGMLFGGTDAASIPLRDVLSFYTQAGSGKAITFATNEVERMRINSTGDVTIGIGAAAAAARLHVGWDSYRQLYLTSESDPVNKQMRLGYDTSNNTAVVEGLLTGAGVSLLLNPSGGNVCVGAAASASNRLTVVDPVADATGADAVLASTIRRGLMVQGNFGSLDGAVIQMGAGGGVGWHIKQSCYNGNEGTLDFYGASTATSNLKKVVQFSGGAAPGLTVFGDVNITGSYLVSGTNVKGYMQTPWITNINAANYNLSDLQQLHFLGIAPTVGWDTASRIWMHGGFGTRFDGHQHQFDVSNISNTRMTAMTIGIGGIVTIPGRANIYALSDRAEGAGVWLDKPGVPNQVYMGLESGSNFWRVYAPAHGNILIVDYATNSVGIATTPAHRLHVSGNFGVDGRALILRTSPSIDWGGANLELQSSGSYGPRIAFHYSGLGIAPQFGLDSSGTFRTYDTSGTLYAPFACAALSVNSTITHIGGGVYSSVTSAGDSWYLHNNVASTRGMPLHHQGSANALEVLCNNNGVWGWVLGLGVSKSGDVSTDRTFTAAGNIQGGTLNGLALQSHGVAPNGRQILTSSIEGYTRAYYLNMVADRVAAAGVATGIAIETNSDGFLRWGTAANLNKWDGPHANAVPLAQTLIWKHFGASFACVVFDASQTTSPTGSAIPSNTTPTHPWTPTYPTLMAWANGATHGVRVDACRYADSAGSISSTTSNLTVNSIAIGPTYFDQAGEWGSMRLVCANAEQLMFYTNHPNINPNRQGRLGFRGRLATQRFVNTPDARANSLGDYDIFVNTQGYVICVIPGT